MDDTTLIFELVAFVLIFSGCLVVGYLVFSKPTPWLSKPTQAADSIEALRTEALKPVVASPGLALAAGESAFYVAQAQLLGTRTSWVRTGGSSGPSFRVMRGLWWHASGYRSRSVPQTSAVVDDVGALTITNRQLFFIGNSHSMALPWDTVIEIEPFTDGVKIATNGHVATFQTGNAVAAIIAQRCRSGNLGATQPEAAAVSHPPQVG
jgi:hypothetical protein